MQVLEPYVATLNLLVGVVVNHVIGCLRSLFILLIMSKRIKGGTVSIISPLSHMCKGLFYYKISNNSSI